MRATTLQTTQVTKGNKKFHFTRQQNIKTSTIKTSEITDINIVTCVVF